MIVVTGAAGFIGSQIVIHLLPKTPLSEGPIVAVDHESAMSERKYLADLSSPCRKIGANAFLDQLKSLKNISLVIHMGAISNTAEKNSLALKKWNVDYTKTLWDYCATHSIPFIYASSAATYGNGSHGFSDNHENITKLKPLNLYGQSKQEFDLFALESKTAPPQWAGLKFFNVYGPHEDHKGRMASSIWHGYHEIRSSQKMTLFRSHNLAYKDGYQSRDFIFVNDILKVIDFFLTSKPANGIYNCGTGQPSTFLELSEALFKNLKMTPQINWIDTPVEFRAGYQYQTCADMGKLRAAGYTTPFTELKSGVSEYLIYLKKVAVDFVDGNTKNTL